MNKVITSRFNALIERKVGLPVSSIKRMCADEITRHIEKSNHISLKLSDNELFSYRGNMLLSAGQIARDIDVEFDKTFGRDGRR